MIVAIRPSEGYYVTKNTQYGSGHTCPRNTCIRNIPTIRLAREERSTWKSLRKKHEIMVS